MCYLQACRQFLLMKKAAVLNHYHRIKHRCCPVSIQWPVISVYHPPQRILNRLSTSFNTLTYCYYRFIVAYLYWYYFFLRCLLTGVPFLRFLVGTDFARARFGFAATRFALRQPVRWVVKSFGIRAQNGQKCVWHDEQRFHVPDAVVYDDQSILPMLLCVTLHSMHTKSSSLIHLYDASFAAISS